MNRRPPQVAILACRAADDAEPTDIYPDDDWPLLHGALAGLGIETTLLAWDHPAVDWRRFDLAVISSTWDSVDRPEEYLAWARETTKDTMLMNPVAAIEWNLDKTYLPKLQARGVPVVPTQWVCSQTEWVPPIREFVVKPSISAGGRQTARYRPDESAAAEAHVRQLLSGGQTVMVQDYVASVDFEGEAKLVFIGGEFSHAVRVGRQLDPGMGVVERLWEKPVAIETITPTTDQLGVAQTVLTAVAAEVGCPLLYARVDLVTDPGGHPMLAEVELIDPSLMLRFAPAAAHRFAEAIHAHRCAPG